MNSEIDFGLKVETLDRIRDVLNAFPEVEKCVVYGSRAMGNYRKKLRHRPHFDRFKTYFDRASPD